MDLENISISGKVFDLAETDIRGLRYALFYKKSNRCLTKVSLSNERAKLNKSIKATRYESRNGSQNSLILVTL